MSMSRWHKADHMRGADHGDYPATAWVASGNINNGNESFRIDI